MWRKKLQQHSDNHLSFYIIIQRIDNAAQVKSRGLFPLHIISLISVILVIILLKGLSLTAKFRKIA